MSFLQSKKVTKPTLVLSIILSLTLIVGINGNSAFAESNEEEMEDIVVKASPQIAKDPFLMKILKQLEIQKRDYALIKENPSKTNILKEKDETTKILDEKRKTAKELLNKELERLNKKYEEFTPRAAFSKFVSKMPDKVHNVYWGMFDFQDNKVKSAQEAMRKVIQNGGNHAEARQAFYDAAAMKRVELIEVTKNLNLKYGLADEAVQVTFDQFGKLPRSED